MMKHILLGTISLFASSTAMAQTGKPSDVPTAVDPWLNGAPYKTDGTTNQLGDGSAGGGGTMAVTAKALTDIPTPTALKNVWIVSDGNVNYTSVPDATTNSEVKFRTQGNIVKCLNDDQIRNFGRPGTSHLHCFYGAASANAWSTFVTLRNRAIASATAGKVASTMAGGPVNASSYWIPALIIVNKNGDGLNYIRNPFQLALYYQKNPSGKRSVVKELPRGHRGVAGVNMDDPYNCKIKMELNVANGAAATCTMPSGRYTFVQDDGSINLSTGNLGNGFQGWSCTNGDPAAVVPSELDTDGNYNSPYLANGDGSDRWPTCTGPGFLSATINSPPCYNGTDLWVPGGYNDRRWRVADSVAGTAVCPNGGFEIGTYKLKTYYYFANTAERRKMRLSADDACALTAGASMPNGACMHADFMPAWDGSVYTQLQNNGQGANATTPTYDFNNSSFNTTQRLVGGIVGEAAPDGSRTAQVTTTWAAPTDLIAPTNKGQGPINLNSTAP